MKDLADIIDNINIRCPSISPVDAHNLASYIYHREVAWKKIIGFMVSRFFYKGEALINISALRYIDPEMIKVNRKSSDEYLVSAERSGYEGR